MKLKELIAVGCGGFLGAIFRYLVSGWAQTLSKTSFPYGTLAVNLLGSLVLGFIAGLSVKTVLAPNVRLFLSIGVLGAFTTFSTFSYETMMLLRTESFSQAFLNITVSLFFGILLVYCGYIAGQAI